MKSKGLIIIPLTIFLLILSSAVNLTATYVRQRKLSLKQIEEVQRSLDKNHRKERRGKLKWKIIWSSNHRGISDKKRRISADFGGP